MALPRAIILGFPKCGTTALKWYLDRYPEIQVTTDEPNHFNANNYADRKRYEKFFDSRYFGIDKSPTLVYGRGNLERLKWLIPDIQIILCVRNPSIRFFSEYHFTRQRMVNTPQFVGIDSPLFMSEEVYYRGLYIRYIDMVLEYFPPENIILVKQEDLDRYPSIVVNKITKKFGLSQMRLWPQKTNRSAPYHIDEAYKHTLDRYYYDSNIALLEKTGIDYTHG